MTNQKQDNISAKPNTTNNKLGQEFGRNEGLGINQMNNGSQANYTNGDQNIYNFFPPKNIPSSELPQPKKTVPPLLPYLANRSEQEYELETTIQTHLKQRSNNPLVCIFHGDEYQCHDMFLQRLKQRSLPRMLELDAKKDVIKEYSLYDLTGGKNPEVFSDYLWFKLRQVTEHDCLASKAEINQSFAQNPSPTIIHISLQAKESENEVLNCINNLLSFWNNWPQLAPNQRLIVCISIKYKINSLKSRGFFWFLKLKKMSECYRYSEIDNTIKNKLGEIKKSKFSQFKRLDGVVLTELSGICQSHVEEWANQIETKEFVGEVGVTQLMKSIRKIFEQNEDLSMEHLADRLIELLKNIETSSEYLI